jgi:hypothetical protein
MVGGNFTYLSPAQCPSPLGGLLLPGATTPCWSGGGSLSLGEPKGQVQMHKGTWKGLGTNLGAPLIRLVRTRVQIQVCLRKQKENMINSQKALSNMLFGGETMVSGTGSGVEVLYCVRVCESVSLRHSLVMKWMWSPDQWVCGELKWSRVNPNRVSGLGLIETYYGQEVAKFLRGEWQEMYKVSVWFVFPCVLERRDSLPPLHSPHLFHPCLCLDVWQMGGKEGGQSKNNPLEL